MTVGELWWEFSPQIRSSVLTTTLFQLLQQLEEIVLQKVCEMISDSSEIGELKKQIFELQQAETHRKQTCFNLEKQVTSE